MKLSNHVKQKHMIASFLITDSARVIRQLVDKNMRLLGLTRAQWFLLNYAYLYDGLSQQEIANLIDLGKGNVATQIHSLVAKGWLRRERHETDGRSFRVYIPTDMRPTIRKLNKVAELSLKNLLNGVEENDVERLIAVMRHIDQQLEIEIRKTAPAKELNRLVEEISAELAARAE